MNHKTLKDIIAVIMGNGALLAAKMFTWLLIPKLLGIYEYGYYKTFTLYLTYMVFLHLGYPDGILLLHGGQRLEELDKKQFRLNSIFFFTMECVIGGVFMLVACSLCGGMTRYILVMLALDMIFVNVSTYFKFVSQAVMRFRELTTRNIFQAVLQAVAVVFIYVLSSAEILQVSGKLYIFCIVLIDGILFIWYLFTYRDIVFGIREHLRTGIELIKRYFRTGILLTTAYQVGHLVFVLDSQMVSLLYDLETYSAYAFAYSVINMVNTALNAVATVLFPNLKRMEREKAYNQLPELVAMVSVLAFFILAGFYPLSWFIEYFLPDYADSLSYLMVVMPGLAVSCCINLIFFTYYKILGWLKKYLQIATLTLAIGLALNVIGHTVYPNPIVYSAASVATLLIWYLLAELPLVREYQLRWKRNWLYLCSVLFLFYLSVQMNRGLAFLIYMGGFLIITSILYRHYFANRKKGRSLSCRR